MKIILFVALCISIVLACNRPSTKSNDPLIYAKSDDPELAKAQIDALNNLDYFINSYHNHKGDSLFQYSLKVDFIYNNQHEHMWIILDSIEKDTFTGYLGNDPQIVKNVKYGDLVTINKKQIEDWLITNSNTDDWEGGYSVKVLQKREQ